jgi:hypothetical protein
MSAVAVSNWTLVGATPNNQLRKWKHDAFDVEMHVSHQSDHYPQDGESHAHGDDEFNQVMRWSAQFKLGGRITVGVNKFVTCDDSCADAETEVLDWAVAWMEESFDEWMGKYPNPDEWRRA